MQREDGTFEFDHVPQDQIEVHWQHPRTELELPLLLVWPNPSINEWAAVVENGVATVVCHEWLFEEEINVDDADEPETEIRKRGEEWGEDEAIPGHVAKALLEYEGEYGPVNEVRNPYTLESDTGGDESTTDEDQRTLTDGGNATATATESDHEIAEAFVDGTDLVPHPVSGQVPIYDGHPPDTHLPAWRCSNCGETSPTILEFWRADRNRDRLVREREAYEYGTDEWDAYNEGVQDYGDRIGRLFSALPAEVSSWVSSEVLSREGRFFEPYPDEQTADTDANTDTAGDTDADSTATAPETCDTCGIEKIGGKCLTRLCEDRHPSVDAVFGGDADAE